ncbi:MAG TPA: regulatory iron-sulfur-containing complex subunit RicT [Phycisphaerae bacterium]|nr:regulatory iron-sulfur-containing complex subunit RicT [Phycisphaerae bacterium]HRR86656.1 regulatory iron-sulfur-containing complex subunit RicT [Phycisphaerae bacterium]
MGKCGGRASAIDRIGPEAERMQLFTTVRYGKMGLIGEFSYPPNLDFTCGGKLVISTDRGLEIGEHVPLTCTGCERQIRREQIEAYTQASSGDETYRFKNGRILREATEADLAEFRHIQATTPQKLAIASKLAAEYGLDMKIVDCEQILGGERIILFFMSEQRVDFRQLVRRLASEFQTRIEMRQVGARDEARLLADYETCGRECCCKNFLKTLKPITMSMAKLQKTTLDLAKVSGRCGRLKCCLRYEHETYDALNKKLPRNNSWVRTPAGIGKVMDRQIITQLVRIRMEDDRIVVVPAEEILETNLPAPPPRPPGDERGNGSSSQRDRREAPAPSDRRLLRTLVPKYDEPTEEDVPIEQVQADSPLPEKPGPAVETQPDSLPKGPEAGQKIQEPSDNLRQQRHGRRGRRSRRRGRRNRPGRGPDGGSSGGTEGGSAKV